MFHSLLSKVTPCPCCAYAHARSRFHFSLGELFNSKAREDEKALEKAVPDLSPELRFDGLTVVDPRDGSKQAGMSVITKMGRIIDVLPTDQARQSPAGKVIDAAGKFVVPGYNDMHSHVLELDDPSGSLLLMLAEGVTGFRQMSGSPELLARRCDGTLPLGRAAPQILEMPGTILTPFNAGSEEDVRDEVRLQKSQGADFVKMGVSSPDVFFAAVDEGRRIGIPVLGHLQEGTDPVEATQAGFRCIEHLGPGSTMWVSCSNEEDQLRADSRRGMRNFFSIPPIVVRVLKPLIVKQFERMLVNPSAYANPSDVHRLALALKSYSADKAGELAQHFVEDGSWHCPTLVRLRTQEYADAPEYERDQMLEFLPIARVRQWRRVTEKWKALPDEMLKTYREAYPRQLTLTKLLSDVGANMIVGTDGGPLLGPGLTLKQEFKELSNAGLTPLTILRMATINAAAYLGRADNMGTIESGRDADMVILEADPLKKVENLHRIDAVVRAGFHYSKGDLDTMRTRVAATRGYLR